MTNKDLLIEGISKDIVSYLMEDYQMSWQEALRRWYNSDTFAKVQDERTGLYIQSSGYVYDFLQNELKTGKIS